MAAGSEWDPVQSLSTIRVTGETQPEAPSRYAQAQLAFDDRYEVLETVSNTRLAQVCRARDRPFARDVAMKVLHRSNAKPTGLFRFFREARIQGQLDHLSVVPVHDLGVDPSGASFFTMKWVRGQTFDAVLRTASPADRLRHLRDACLGIQFAHEHGVVHRDLKPKNLMVDERGRLYVLDWGLAKLRNDTEEIDRPIQDASGAVETREGSVLGTIGYMAPEQLRGDTDVDARADVYSLGTLLYEVLTGRPLHGGGKAQAALSLLKRDGARPSEVTSSDGVAPPNVSQALDEACYHATRVEPTDRLAEAGTLAEHLDRALKDGIR